MKVVTNDKIVFVGWKYPNPELEHKMVLHGLHPKLLKEMTQPQICLALGIKPKDLPLPPTTECIIVDTGKEVLVKVSVKRFYKDPYNKEKARKYSLSKALHKLYPNPHTVERVETGELVKLTPQQVLENEEAAAKRKVFWDAYLSRSHKPEAVVPAEETKEEHQEA